MDEGVNPHSSHEQQQSPCSALSKESGLFRKNKQELACASDDSPENHHPQRSSKLDSPSSDRSLISSPSTDITSLESRTSSIGDKSHLNLSRSPLSSRFFVTKASAASILASPGTTASVSGDQRSSLISSSSEDRSSCTTDPPLSRLLLHSAARSVLDGTTTSPSTAYDLSSEESGDDDDDDHCAIPYFSHVPTRRRRRRLTTPLNDIDPKTMNATAAPAANTLASLQVNTIPAMPDEQDRRCFLVRVQHNLV
jgi:hypothetical protein